MADQIFPTFEHEILEADIKRLSQEIKKHLEKPEASKLSGHEILKKSIKSYTAVNIPTTGEKKEEAEQPASPLPAYLREASPEEKLEIEALLDLAYHEGILKADKEARKSSFFILDAFHDSLAKSLMPRFQKEGILK